VQFVFTEEQDELRRSLRRFLEERSPLSAVRRVMESPEGYDRGVWTQMAEQLGLQGIALPEGVGGAGCGAVEVGIVMEELGRALLPSPYFASVCLAANALVSAADGAARAAYLPGIADGSTVATLALCEASGSWAVGDVAMEAMASGDGWTLTGTKRFVLSGAEASLFLVVARTPAGVSLFAVEAGAEGLECSPLPVLDLTRPQADLTFAATPARLVSEGDVAGALQVALDRATIALTAEQVGGAARCLETSVAYAKQRIQFGRPIGSFQAIKHKCADMLVDVESARSTAYYAAWALEEGEEDPAELASLAKAACSEAYFHCAAENIQIHGGIGFTWEHDAHLFFKRAKTDELLLGDPVTHRARLAHLIAL
jgi:alkylation response protein AidB-like acyl-CoA dehydrogenase